MKNRQILGKLEADRGLGLYVASDWSRLRQKADVRLSTFAPLNLSICFRPDYVGYEV